MIKAVIEKEQRNSAKKSMINVCTLSLKAMCSILHRRYNFRYPPPAFFFPCASVRSVEPPNSHMELSCGGGARSPPSFASRVKTPYNGSFGGRGNKARLAISFPAESGSLARTVGGCSPPHGTVPRGSGRLRAASSWPLSKATPIRLIARSLARTAGVSSPPQMTTPRGSGRLRAASSWPLSKATPAGLIARSLARTAGGCSPLHGTIPRGSGRLRAASSWPFYKATPTRFIARSLARTVGGCSPPQGQDRAALGS